MKAQQWSRVRVIMACFLLPVTLAMAADPASSRFTLVLNGAAVKDNQTGLIWEQEPDREHDVWGRSVARCLTKEVGGQTGWRAPSVDELKTLIDPSQHDPALPAGHPFSNIDRKSTRLNSSHQL